MKNEQNAMAQSVLLAIAGAWQVYSILYNDERQIIKYGKFTTFWLLDIVPYLLKNAREYGIVW